MYIDGKEILSLDVPDEMEFRHAGCENCDNGLGNNVYMCKAHFAGGNGNWDYYEILLCHGCVCSHHNADPLPEDCNDRFEL